MEKNLTNVIQKCKINEIELKKDKRIDHVKKDSNK